MTRRPPDGGAIDGHEPAFVDVGGRETRYFDVGDGPPVVLVHGGLWGGSSSANTWGPQLSRLGERFRVVAFDRLGCGLTEAPEDEDRFVFPESVEHAAGLLDAVGVEDYHLVGSSMGAGLALALALRGADEPRTLTVVNSATISPPVGDLEHRRELLNRGHPGSRGDVEAQRERISYELSTLSYRTDHLTDDFLETAARMATTEGSRRVAEVLRGEAGDRLAASIDSAMADARRALDGGAHTVPTLVVWGRDDVSVPLSAATSVFDRFGSAEPAVELHLFNRCGHFPYRERPDAFAGVFETFVDARGGP